jgi:hypothetical protein
MELHFFFKVDSGMVMFVAWDLLSANIYEGQVNGISIMPSLIQRPHSFSIPCFIATNSSPKTEVSMVACFLQNTVNQSHITEDKETSA